MISPGNHDDPSEFLGAREPLCLSLVHAALPATADPALPALTTAERSVVVLRRPGSRSESTRS